MSGIAYIMGTIGVVVGLMIGILFWGEIDSAIDCPTVDEDAVGNEECKGVRNIAWTMTSILPLIMFFALFAIFGGFKRKSPLGRGFKN